MTTTINSNEFNDPTDANNLRLTKPNVTKFLLQTLLKSLIFSGFIFAMALLVYSYLRVLVNQNMVFFLPKNRLLVVPKSLQLNEMEHMTFRNGSLYRYHSNHLILKNEREMERISSLLPLTTSGENDEMVFNIVVTGENENDGEYGFECQGVCECYENEENYGNIERRNMVGSLVYSHRYTSFVIVSVIGFAVSKFVDENIDVCYQAAKEGLEDGKSVTCSIEKAECTENVEGKKIGRKRWSCNGHCINNKAFGTGNKKKVKTVKATGFRKVNCKGRWAGREVVVVEEGFDKIKQSRMAAMELYRNRHLVPFCKSIKAHYLTEKTAKTGKKIVSSSKVSPCIGFSKEAKVECKVAPENDGK